MTQTTWFQHALERTGWTTRNQAAALLVPGVFIMLVFGGIYLSQVASYAATNRHIEELIAVRDRLERDNERLRGEIAELETVPRLLSRAEELGFLPAEAIDIEYMVIDGYNPNRSRTVIPVREAEEQEAVATYDATFSGWLQQQFDLLRRQFDTFGRR